MKRGLQHFLLFFSLLISLILPARVLANDEFATNYEVRYQIFPNGKVTVKQEISLTNKLANVYATQYSLSLEGVSIENIHAYDSEGPLETKVSQKGQTTTINFKFNKQVVGKDNQLNFTLNYEALDLATKNGQIWEINIPRLADSNLADQYNLTLAVPKTFGEPALMRPSPVETLTEPGFNLYRFTQKQISNMGVSASFGEFQIFDFVLTYHLENPNLTLGETEVALPPDTSFQQVFYSQIKPEPENVRVDDDGNWLAKYRLGPKEKLNLTVTGQAKIFSQGLKRSQIINQENLAKNKLPQKYWPVDDPQIKTISQKFKVPKDVYNYVVNTLEYDFSRVSENTKRLGALEAINKPQKATCMEFTDLFITLSRAAGIPAREINGFAYTTNDQLRPLSLVSDVLHAWPEYWDEKKQIWIPVDPTWEKTTGGVDYFTKTDLNHFAFVIHGEDSEKPYPAGAYKTESSLGKDVQVVFGQYKKEEDSHLEVKFDLPKKFFWRMKTKATLNLQNKGSQALYEVTPEIKSEELEIRFLKPEDEFLTILPPYGQKKIDLELNLKKLINKKSGLITVWVNNQNFNFSFEIVATFWPIIIGVIALLAILLLIFLTRPWNYVRKIIRKQ